MVRAAATLLAGLLSWPAAALGEEPVAATPPAPVRLSPTFAVRFGAPLSAAASAGVIRGPRREKPGSCPSVSGWLARAEAGVGGARLDLGPAFTYCYTRFGSVAAGALTASLVRTWGRPIGADAERTYLGPTLTLGVADWSLGLGVLWRLGTQEGGRALFAWSLGRGF